MLIAQVTDIHIGFDPGNPDERNMQRFRQVLQRLVDGPNRPDLLLLTGDVTDLGDAQSYARLAEAVSQCPFPVQVMTGNHDDRAELLAAFPQVQSSGGFVHYALELDGLRLLALDTLEVGRQGGAFCEARAAWLAAQLAAHPDTPTLIAMHHPPFATGIEWLDCGPDDAWVARFAAAIAGHSQIKGIIAGHVHRTIHTVWNGVPILVCASCAPTAALDLNAVDPDIPDGRAMITDEPASYALHRWDGNHLISHCESVGEWAVLARYDAGIQEVVQQIEAERG